MGSIIGKQNRRFALIFECSTTRVLFFRRSVFTALALSLRKIDLSAALAELESQRNHIQTGLDSDLVDQVTLIGKMNRVGIVDKAYEGRRPIRHLGGVIEL